MILFRTKSQSKWAVQDLNQNSQSLSNKEVRGNRNSRRVQNRVHNSEICPELKQIITAWPELSDKVKKIILVLIETEIDKR